MNIIKISILVFFLPLLLSAQDNQEKKLSNSMSDTSKIDNKENNFKLNKDQYPNAELNKKKKTETPNKIKNQPKKEIKEIKNTGNFQKNTKISKKKIGKTSR